MAIIGNYTQQPADRIDYDVDCSGVLGDGDTLTDAVCSVTPVTDPVLTVSPALFGSDTVKMWVSGGVAGNTYKVELTVTTSNTLVKQDELKFRIKDY
jgi:hypothetical protein